MSSKWNGAGSTRIATVHCRQEMWFNFSDIFFHALPNVVQAVQSRTENSSGEWETGPRGNKVIIINLKPANVASAVGWARLVSVCISDGVYHSKYLCYMESFWPHSGRDVQDNWMLSSFSCEENLTQHGQFYASNVNLSERVEHYPWPHPWLILGIPIWSTEATSYNMHVIDAIMRCSFELDQRKYPHRRTRAFFFLSFQNNYSPMLTRFSLCCVGDPQTWCWNGCGFWFSVKSGLRVSWWLAH